MKNVITIVACVLILAVFMAQVTTNEITHSKILFAETEVNTAVQKAKQDGCFTQENINNLVKRLADKLNCEESEIVIGPSGTTDGSTTRTPVYRGELVYYYVKYPVKGVVGAGKFLGISDNTALRVLSGATASEYVGP